MVKFGAALRDTWHTPWASHYVDYGRQKKILSAIEKTTSVLRVTTLPDTVRDATLAAVVQMCGGFVNGLDAVR
jgi:hypothetical protein